MRSLGKGRYFKVIEKSQNRERKLLESEIRKLEKELKKIIDGIETMEECIPQAICGCADTARAGK